MTRKQFRQLYTYYNYIPYYLRIALRLPAAWESHNKKRDRNWVLVKYHTQSYSGTRAPTWVKSWWENEPPARWLSSSMGIDGVWRNGKYILWHKPEGKFRFRKTQTFKIKNNSLVKGDIYLRAKQLRELSAQNNN